MNITFLIGNGFDLRLGLKTSYTHMYQAYMDAPSANEDIAKLKKMLREDAPNGYKTWGDFEMAMARHAHKFASEEAFIGCVRDFRDHMVAHLEEQNEIFRDRLEASSTSRGECIKEFEKSLSGFYKGLTPNAVHSIEGLMLNQNRTYNYIVFNYTTTLDELEANHRGYARSYVSSRVHIHGTLGSDIVLGVDSLDQILETPYPITRRMERTFIKPRFNEMYDRSRVAQARIMISTSDVICVYGMAFGESDATWTAEIIDWLRADTKRHLIYFVHNKDEIKPSRRDEMMDMEDEKKEALLSRICKDKAVADQIFDQIHIPVGYDIFDFDNRLKSMQGELTAAV